MLDNLYLFRNNNPFLFEKRENMIVMDYGKSVFYNDDDVINFHFFTFPGQN